jgi:hypothetical protein
LLHTAIDERRREGEKEGARKRERDNRISPFFSTEERGKRKREREIREGEGERR